MLAGIVHLVQPSFFCGRTILHDQWFKPAYKGPTSLLFLQEYLSFFFLVFTVAVYL